MPVPNEGEVELLNKLPGEDVDLGLYTNDYTPTDTTTLTDLTEATFNGYARKRITQADWSAASTDANGVTKRTAPQQSWTNNDASPVTIYGSFLVGVTSGKLIAVKRFTNSVTLNPGSTLNVDPELQLD